MTLLLSAFRPKWETMCLALFLICQIIQGYPRRESPLVNLINSTAHDTQSNISTLIEASYQNHELMQPKEWKQNDDGQMINWSVQRGKRCQDASLNRSSIVSSEQEQRRSLSNNRRGSDASSQSDGTIVFPTDERMVHHTLNFNAGVAPICQDATFCENVSYYPGRLVNEAIGRNDSLKYLANVDVVSDIVQRIDTPDERPLCISEEQVVYPQSAENKRKEWLFVVNQDNFKQGVRIEICNDQEHQCNVIDGFSEGYRTTCKQKYIYRQLAALGNDGDVVSDMFRFPSSCCCHVKFTGDPLLRIGGRIDERSNRTAVSSLRRK